MMTGSKKEAAEGGEGCSQFVHGRSRMTIDPQIPTMPGRSTSGFHQPTGEGRGWGGARATESQPTAWGLSLAADKGF